MEENEKKTNKGKAILITVIVLIVLAIGTVGAYYLVTNKNSENKNNTNQNDMQKDTEQSNDITNNEQLNNTVENGNTLENTERTNTSVENKEEISGNNVVNNTTTNITEKTNNATKPTQKTNTSTTKKPTVTNTIKPTKKPSQSTTGNKTGSTTQTKPSTNQKPNTTQTTPNTTNNKTETEKPTIVKTETDKKLTKTDTKYGVVTKTYTTTVYNVYSDGSKKVKSTKTSTEYDQSGYKATTAELLPEARQLSSSNSGLINGVLGYVNKYRKEANEKAVDNVTNRENLVLDSNLTNAACARAMEMAYGKKFSHTRPNGTECFSILEEMGIRYMTAGENIAAGQTSAQSVSNSWRHSPGHYSNMINQDFSKIGIGVIKYRGTYYWAQLFTN